MGAGVQGNGGRAEKECGVQVGVLREAWNKGWASLRDLGVTRHSRAKWCHVYYQNCQDM